jgi:exodeoxyribonuclease V alpha subunit
MPVVELTAVKRYGGLIASAAQDVRAGRWPNLSADLKDSIAFLPCKRDGITDLVVSLYDAAPAETQILCAKRSGPDGVKAINEACQARYTRDGKHLTIWNEEFEQQQGTGLYLQDLVMCNRNRWDVGIQNGSLGRIVSFEKVPFVEPNGEELGRVLGGIEWDDGVVRPLYESMLDDLELGYGITVHKAQGSQWAIIIIPLTANRLLDRTLIYTAMTRARTKVILVGDPAAAKAAVEALPKSYYRQTGLKIWLERALVS